MTKLGGLRGTRAVDPAGMLITYESTGERGTARSSLDMLDEHGHAWCNADQPLLFPPDEVGDLPLSNTARRSAAVKVAALATR